MLNNYTVNNGRFASLNLFKVAFLSSNPVSDLVNPDYWNFILAGTEI